MTKYKYSLNQPFTNNYERSLITEILDSNYLSTDGKYTKLFEKEFTELHHMNYGLAVQSGTAAVHCALVGIGINPGDHVAVPAFTCTGSYSPIAQQRGTIVAVDVDPYTFGMDYEELVKAHDRFNLSAVVIVHIYGYPARDFVKIRDFCRSNKIKIIEDCAEAHGSRIDDDTYVGSTSDAAAFSIRSEKLIGVGEGGIVCFNNEEYYDRAHWFANRCKGQEADGWEYKYETNGIGCNYKLSHVLGGIAYAQLQRLKLNITRREEINKQYVLNLPSDVEMQYPYPGSHPSYWLNAIRLFTDPGEQSYSSYMDIRVKAIGDALMASGIEIRGGFRSPIRMNLGVPVKSTLNDYYAWEADKLYSNLLCLPSHPQLTNDNVKEICDKIKVLKQKYE